jgi:hypothetical protein
MVVESLCDSSSSTSNSRTALSDDGECQGGDVGVEEAVEAAADPVVVERLQLRGIKPEALRDVASGPLGEARPSRGSRETRRFLSRRSSPVAVGMRERRSSCGRWSPRIGSSRSRSRMGRAPMV